MPEFTNKYFNLSVGPGDMRGPWNQGPQWEFVDGEQAMQNADKDGDGSFAVELDGDEQALGEEAKERLMSDPGCRPDDGRRPRRGPGGGSDDRAIRQR